MTPGVLHADLMSRDFCAVGCVLKCRWILLQILFCKHFPVLRKNYFQWPHILPPTGAEAEGRHLLKRNYLETEDKTGAKNEVL